jgi:hypothetical protein
MEGRGIITTKKLIWKLFRRLITDTSRDEVVEVRFI